ncbi:MAG: rhodanese-like domain-containing protein [Flavobacteriaceae bacterium]
MSFFSFLFGRGESNNNIKVLSPSEFKFQIQNKVQLVDVRTPAEYSSGAIKGAKNINYFSGSFSSEIKKLSKTKPVYVYCQSGMRSRKASRKIAKMGFPEVYDLQGGISNFK